jgi:hypothetical protein
MQIGTLLLICALGLSGTAAYYSIAGLAAIFSSAFWPVVVMASILEISKLVVASWLYQRWNVIPGLIKTYLTAAVVMLMLITSLGIFGFLSKAHVDQGLSNIDAALRIEEIDSQVSQIRITIQQYETQLQQLDRSINIQLDANRAAQALASRRQQETERGQIRTKLDEEQQRLRTLLQNRTILRQQATVLESKVGPIRYVAEFFVDGGTVDLDKAVRWMIIILVLVFDPLAVLMLIAANMSYNRRSLPNQSVNDHKGTTTNQPTQQSLGPTYGNTMYNKDDGKLYWFNGISWAAIEYSEHERVVEIQERIQVIDRESVHLMIKEAMDSWLTTVSNQPHVEERSASEQDQIEKSKDHTDIEPDQQPTVDESTKIEEPTEVLQQSSENNEPPPRVGRTWL